MKTTIKLIYLLLYGIQKKTYLIPYLNFLSLTEKPTIFIPLKAIKS